MNIGELLNQTFHIFENEGIQTARLDAEVLLSRYLKADRTELFVHSERIFARDELEKFEKWVARRCRREPVAYITGEKEFWAISFEVTSDVLIPRPDTEILVEEAMQVLSHERDYRILEMGTGSGAISIALAKEFDNVMIVATDISAAAIAVAERNASRHNVQNRITFLTGNLLEPVEGMFDMIVSNPPYISEYDFSELPAGVADYEPRCALLCPGDGTAFHRVLINEGANYLKSGGRLFIEIGEGQKDRVAALFLESNLYDDVGFRKDYAGHDRVAKGRRR